MAGMGGPGAAVRPALPADAERCAQLCHAALAEVQPWRGGPLFTRREIALVAQAMLRPGGLRRLVVDGKRHVIVGSAGTDVVGFAAGHVEEVGDVCLGVIDLIYVEAGERRASVGRSLLGGLVDWFGTVGCKGVDGYALPGDRATKQLYEGAGFTARLLTMHRDEPAGAPGEPTTDVEG
jgi:hypothetical protein